MLHLSFQFFGADFMGQEIHHREPLIDVKHTVPLFIWKVLYIPRTIFLVSKQRILSSECINIKRNTNLLTEPNKITHLFDRIQQHISHRTTPIQDKDQTVILTIGKSCYFFKQVFIVSISM